MRRMHLHYPAPNWQATVESQGFHFHTPDGSRTGTRALLPIHLRRDRRNREGDLRAGRHVPRRRCSTSSTNGGSAVSDSRRHSPTGSPTVGKPTSSRSTAGSIWRYDGARPPKLLEYNADTPTSLLEAAVIQWHWMQDVFPKLDQFNSIHERLIEAWKRCQPRRKAPIYFTSPQGNVEDYMTVNYLRDTAMQAGLETEYIGDRDIGWNAPRQRFVDRARAADRDMLQALSLGMADPRSIRPAADLATRRAGSKPPWKMILSNKAILAGAVGDVPRQPVPAAGVVRADRRLLRSKADALARRGEYRTS